MKCRERIFALLLAVSLLLGLGVTGLAAAPEGPGPVILMVTGGTALEDGVKLDIGGVEAALAVAWPDYEIRCAFTSQAAIDAVKERDGLEIDSLSEAMDQLVADGIRDVIVQPALVIGGAEYEEIRDAAQEYAGKFDSLRLGAPLLAGENAGEQLAAALSSELRRWAHRDTAIVLVGRSAEDGADAAYTGLQETLTDAGYDKVFVGTGGSDPDVEDVLARIEQAGVKKIVLLPLLVAMDELADDEIAAWKSVLEDAGYKVTCVMKGIGQYRGVQRLIVSQVEEAERITAPDTEPEPAEEPAEEPEEEPAEEPEEEPAEEPEEEPAEEAEVSFAAAGVKASDLVPGIYPLKVHASLSRFQVKDAVLVVEEDGMTARLTMDGHRYGELFPGTAADAEQAAEEELISFSWDEDDSMVFALPVTSLDTELTCAAWSIRRGCWLDLVLILSSAELPEDAFVG